MFKILSTTFVTVAVQAHGSGHGHWHGDVYHEHAHGGADDGAEQDAHQEKETGHGHYHGDVYHEHDHDSHGHGHQDPMSKVDPNYELTNEEFLKMDATEFWEEALPKLDPSKLERIIQELDKDHLQKMLSSMPGMPEMPAEEPENDADIDDDMSDLEKTGDADNQEL